MPVIRYWSEEGHWVQWQCDLPPGPGLYRAADDQWTLDETGTLVQVITGTELVSPA